MFPNPVMNYFKFSFLQSAHIKQIFLNLYLGFYIYDFMDHHSYLPFKCHRLDSSILYSFLTISTSVSFTATLPHLSRLCIVRKHLVVHFTAILPSWIQLLNKLVFCSFRIPTSLLISISDTLTLQLRPHVL